jgi:predicted ATPase/class 3 adenylate cyclase
MHRSNSSYLVTVRGDSEAAVEHHSFVRNELPSGTVTFVFTDVEGSTRLLHELGPEAYGKVLAEHRRVVREAAGRHGGIEVDTQGDAFFIAFPTAPGALQAAADTQAGLSAGPIRVRMGVHTGTPHLAEEGYVGADVHRAARIAACGHGGQVLVSSATASLLKSDDLRDLGEHRLKDLSAPERIYQLGEAEFPRLKSLHQTNLPVPATAFVGRVRELGEVIGLLGRDDLRLLTLTGTGGTGKTRLGLQAAGGVAERYPQGVWWVPLASLTNAALVLEAAARELGAKDDLAAYIGDKRMLLFFDNFEHLLDAAGDISALLGACPNLDLLVTTRERLHVGGEQEYPVPPLAPNEAVDFFVARARAAVPEFKAGPAVTEICRRLDDLPLALELAAARVKALSSAQILERLEQRLPLLTGGARDLPERQRTLRATIEWSFELLSPNEQILFARFGVFVGGCTLAAAEAVAEADLDAVQSLVDKSLVRYSEERYWMLETIREYAVERLNDSADVDELRRRQADYFLGLAEEAEPHVRHYSRDAYERLAQDHDNLRAALDWFESAGETQLALRLAGALAEFWSRKHMPEGRRRLESVLAADARRTLPRAKALNGLSDMVLTLESEDTGRLKRQYAQEALELNRALGDSWGAAWSTVLLGSAAAEDMEWAEALPRFEEAAKGFAELGDEHYVLFSDRMAAWMHSQLGDLDRARAIHETNLTRARAAGISTMEAHSLEALVDVGVEDPGHATAMLVEAYRLHSELGDPYRQQMVLCRLASVLASEQRPETAAEVLACAETLLEEGGGASSWLIRKNAATLARIHEQLDEMTVTRLRSQGQALAADDALALAVAAMDARRTSH